MKANAVAECAVPLNSFPKKHHVIDALKGNKILFTHEKTQNHLILSFSLSHPPPTFHMEQIASNERSKRGKYGGGAAQNRSTNILLLQKV